MNVLDLKLTGAPAGTVIRIDGAPLKTRKNKFKNGEARYETEKNSVRIEAFRYADVGGAVWFVLQLVFFLISIFGIFDMRRREKCIKPCFAADVALTGADVVTLKANHPRAGQRAFEIQTDARINELSNEYYLDGKEKKKLKALLVAKILVAVAAVAAIVAGILLSL